MEEKTLKPKYLQIKDYFEKKIEDNDYANDGRLPSEREISEKFGVSRMTARNAILELVKDGSVYRKGANGTFVSQIKMKRNFFPMGGLSMHMKDSGIKDPVNKVLVFEKGEADCYVSKLLDANIGTVYYHMLRLRSGNGEPLALDETYINGEYVKGLEKYDFSKTSLWQKLTEAGEHKIVRGSNNIEIYFFDSREGKLLNIKKGEPGFKVSNINYDKYGNVIEHSTTLYRGDMFMFSYEVSID